MDLRDCYTEWSKSNKDNYHDITYMWNLKKSGTIVLINKTEIESQM